MIQIYDEPAEAIKTAHKKCKKLTSSQVFGIITVKEFQEHELLKNLYTLCCIRLGRCCLGVETRVIIKISKNPCYPVNVD